MYLIGDEITFAGLMLILPAFVAGMVAAAPRIEAGVRREMRVGEAAAAAAVAAAAAGGVFAVAVLLTDLIGVERIRTVFIKISPQLMEFLSFGRSTVGGAVIIVVVSTAAGVAGGLLRVAPPTIRKPVSMALIVTAMFGFLQRVIPIALDQLDPGAGLALQPDLRRSDLDRRVRRGGGHRRRDRPERSVRRTDPRKPLRGRRARRGTGDQSTPPRPGCGRRRHPRRRPPPARVRGLRGARQRDGVRSARDRSQHRRRATRACSTSATSSSSRSARTPSRCSPGPP